MENLREKYGWILATVLGSAIFAFGFAFFLAPGDLNAGGISGLAMIVVEVLGVGSVGLSADVQDVSGVGTGGHGAVKGIFTY